MQNNKSGKGIKEKKLKVSKVNKKKTKQKKKKKNNKRQNTHNLHKCQIAAVLCEKPVPGVSPLFKRGVSPSRRGLPGVVLMVVARGGCCGREGPTTIQNDWWCLYG